MTIVYIFTSNPTELGDSYGNKHFMQTRGGKDWLASFLSA